eukprot:11080436-Alexandrium_andersonii.AAC.1
MSASLVGSEMCIRDSGGPAPVAAAGPSDGSPGGGPAPCLPVLARYGRQALAVQIQRWWKKWSRRAPAADAA